MLRTRGPAGSVKLDAGFGVFLWLLALSAAGDAANAGHKLGPKNQAISERRQERIDDELQTLKDHTWAGDYYYGDSLGVKRCPPMVSQDWLGVHLAWLFGSIRPELWVRA